MRKSNSMVLIALIAISVSTVGCASSQDYAHQKEMYQMKVDAQKNFVPTPIFQMTAIEGQTITLSGVKQISVYAPNVDSNKIVEPEATQSVAKQVWGEIKDIAKFMVNPVSNVILGLNASDNAVKIKQIESSERTQLGTAAFQAIAKPPCVISEFFTKCE